MNRNTQSGSVGTFVIVGVVLAAAALAVLYGVRQFTISQRVSPAPTDITLPSGDDSTKLADNNKQSQQDEKKQEDAKPETSEADKTDQKAGNKEADVKSEAKSETGTKAETTTPRNNVSETVSSSDSDLPQTGPADSMAAILLLGGTTAIATAYVRSRRLI